jgi:hypothetical protein
MSAAAAALIGLLGSALAPAGGPVIRARDTDGCPSAEDVSARVAGLLVKGGVAGMAGDDGAAPDVVDLSLAGAALRVRLTRADGTLVAQRDLQRSALRRGAVPSDCAELAEAAAVLVAAWEADLRSGPAPVAPDAPVVMPAAEVTISSVLPSRASYELSLTTVALWLGREGATAGAGVRGVVWSRRALLGMTAGMSATFPGADTSERSVFLRRYAGTAGVVGRLVQVPFFVDALAEVVLGWLVVAGDAARGGRGTYGAFDPGVSVGLRGGRRILPRLELSLGVAGWAASWGATTAGGADERSRPTRQPRWGILAGVGVGLLFGR